MALFKKRLIERVSPEMQQRMRGVRLWIVSSAFFLNEVWVILQERKSPGIFEELKLPLRVIKYFGLLALIFCVFRQKALMASLLIAWFHRVDDVVDGDSPLPQVWTARMYRDQKRSLLAVAARGDDAQDLLFEDLMLLGSFEVGRILSMSVADEAISVWEVMEWGCERQENKTLVSRDELLRQTAKQDRAVLRIAAKMFGGDIARYDVIAEGFTGVLTRTDWLDDIPEDLPRGVVNIPAEAFSQYGVELDAIASCNNWTELMRNTSFARWYHDEVLRSQSEWQQFRDLLGDNFGNVFTSRLKSRIFSWMTVRLLERQFRRIAVRVT